MASLKDVFGAIDNMFGDDSDLDGDIYGDDEEFGFWFLPFIGAANDKAVKNRSAKTIVEWKRLNQQLEKARENRDSRKIKEIVKKMRKIEMLMTEKERTAVGHGKSEE